MACKQPPVTTKTTATSSSEGFAAANEMTTEVEYGILTDNARRKSRSHSLKDCHVQFEPVFVDEGKSDEVAVATIWRGENTVEVQLGFLQYMHKYEVNFVLDEGGLGLRSESEHANKNAKIVSVEPHGDGSTSKLDIKMEVYVATDKVLLEKCPIQNGERALTFHLHAKVLSKDKGTPLLRKGIHCIEHYLDEESEYGN